VGLTYYRWWLTDRLVEGIPVYMLNGSSLYVAWLRALGAKIGPEVNLGALTVRAPELLSIGAGTSIGNAVNLENARVEGGWLLLGRIDIGANACIGSYSVVEGDVRIEDHAHIDGQSALASGTTVPAARIWSGSPARDRGAFDVAQQTPRPPVSGQRLAWESAAFALGSLFVAVVFFFPVFPTFLLIDWLDVDAISVRPAGDGHHRRHHRLCAALHRSCPVAACHRGADHRHRADFCWHPLGLLPSMKAGTWPVHSNRYLAKRLVNQIQSPAWRYCTAFTPPSIRQPGTGCWAPRWARTPNSPPPWAWCPTCSRWAMNALLPTR
jgi:non-ribosomal peptide synthetase-like protein